MSSSLVLPRHIDSAFDALDLDQSGLLYVSDAVLALDSLLVACYGTKGSLSEHQHQSTSSPDASNNNSPSRGGASSPSNNAVSSGSGSTSDSLTLPGVSRSKIVQALKSSLLKANVDPDEVAISSRPVVTIDIFRNTAQSLLSPLPNVPQSDVETFAAFQSLNSHNQDKTRVDRSALRKSLFAEYDSDVYIVKDEDDLLEERIRSGSVATANSNSNYDSNNQRSNSINNKNNQNQQQQVGTGKFDGIRNMVGCDDLMLSKFSKYPQQGFSFDEWKNLVEPVQKQ